MDEDLGSHVLRSADEAESPVLILLHLLASSHVNQLEVAISADHDIFGLEVSIDDALLMEDLQHVDQQGTVEAGLFQREDADGSDNIK